MAVLCACSFTCSACASAACYGSSSSVASSLSPKQLIKYRSVATFDFLNYACGITFDGTLDCWVRPLTVFSLLLVLLPLLKHNLTSVVPAGVNDEHVCVCVSVCARSCVCAEISHRRLLLAASFCILWLTTTSRLARESLTTSLSLSRSCVVGQIVG